MVNRAYQTPPRFHPLIVRGWAPSWWYFPCGTLIGVTFLLTQTPSLITTYRLTPLRVNHQTTHTYHLRTLTSHSTTHYISHSTTMLCLHIPLHCLHVSPTSADQLNKEMWKATSARTRIVCSKRSLWVYSQSLIIVQWKDNVILRS
jgi:hypothetical protein